MERAALVVLSVALGACSLLVGDTSTPAPVLEMLQAAGAGDLVRCRQLVAGDPELIDAVDGRRRQTPLHRAAFAGRQEVVEWLLAQGVDVDPRDRFRSTPLSGAAFSGHTQVAETLLDHGADPEASDDEDATPLDVAASHQHLDTAIVLVARGASIHGGASGFDPISYFARFANRDGVEWALSHGATLAPPDPPFGLTPLHWLAKGSSVSREEALAARLGGASATERSAMDVEDARYLDVFGVLVAHGADVDALGDREDAPLHLAARADNLAIAKALLDASASIDPRDHHGQTPLALAALQEHVEMVELLVTRGADVDARDHAGFTPLVTVMRWGEREATVLQVAETLIGGGADVDARKPGGGWGPAGNDGLTALQQAAESGYVSVVELLLRSGADVDLKFTDGRTPLYWAARNGHADVVASLIAHGADVNGQASRRTALGAARDSGHGTIVSMLREHGATR